MTKKLTPHGRPTFQMFLKEKYRGKEKSLPPSRYTFLGRIWTKADHANYLITTKNIFAEYLCNSCNAFRYDTVNKSCGLCRIQMEGYASLNGSENASSIIWVNTAQAFCKLATEKVLNDAF